MIMTIVSEILIRYPQILSLRQTKPCFVNKELRSYHVKITDSRQITGIHIYQPLRSGRIWHKVNF